MDFLKTLILHIAQRIPLDNQGAVLYILVSLRKRPTSEIRGPQTVGVIGQHNTAHEIPKIDVFISEPQITGILIGTVGAALQT